MVCWSGAVRGLCCYVDAKFTDTKAPGDLINGCKHLFPERDLLTCS